MLNHPRASPNEVSCADARSQGSSQRRTSRSPLDRMGGVTPFYWIVEGQLTFRQGAQFSPERIKQIEDKAALKQVVGIISGRRRSVRLTVT